MKLLRYIVAASIAANAASVYSREFVVLVGTTSDSEGTPANTFVPNHLPNVAGDAVQPGDIITFQNVFAAGFHNARSIDAEFPFSCGSGGCASSAPASGLWTSSVTVPVSAAGRTIRYQCDAHGNASAGTGMIGSIDVSTTTPVLLQSFEVE